MPICKEKKCYVKLDFSSFRISEY